MILIDSSLWIAIYRDRSGRLGPYIRNIVGARALVFSHFVRLEVLQGCKDEAEWSLTLEHFADQTFVEASEATWIAAARIYFDLRRKGLTVNSTLDCCIAQIAIERGLLLLHNDSDFEMIATLTSLKHQRINVYQGLT